MALHGYKQATQFLGQSERRGTYIGARKAPEACISSGALMFRSHGAELSMLQDLTAVLLASPDTTGQLLPTQDADTTVADVEMLRRCPLAG